MTTGSTFQSLPDEIRPAMQAVMPSTLATCSKDGVPNVTYISQVFWVDAHYVALSFQFFNKTIRNVRENPHACVNVTDPTDLTTWTIELHFDHSETDGPLFDAMDMQIEAIASMTGMSDVFKLKAADVYKVKAVRKTVVLD